MNPGKIFSLQVFNDRKVNQQKDLVYHSKEPSILKKADLQFYRRYDCDSEKKSKVKLY
jgi:hypothetical protein